MSNVIYEKEGVLCSFPYHFVLKEEGDEWIGEEVSYIYCGLKLNETEIKEVEDFLATIHTSEGASFYLDGEEINYRITMKGNKKESMAENEVNIRRNFIENYLEAEDDLDDLVKKFHGTTKKTEFIMF